MVTIVLIQWNVIKLMVTNVPMVFAHVLSHPIMKNRIAVR